jgi:hypothetical protein
VDKILSTRVTDTYPSPSKTIVSPEDQNVTFVELSFDLVLVLIESRASQVQRTMRGPEGTGCIAPRLTSGGLSQILGGSAGIATSRRFLAGYGYPARANSPKFWDTPDFRAVIDTLSNGLYNIAGDVAGMAEEPQQKLKGEPDQTCSKSAERCGLKHIKRGGKSWTS